MANFTFSTPANIADFPAGSSQANCLLQLWNWNLIGDTLTAITGDPWNVLNDFNRYFYFNPVVTAIPATAKVAHILWPAFPNRVLWYFSQGGSAGNPFQLSTQATLELGDTGKVAGNPDFANGFPPVPSGLNAICPQLDWSSDQSKWQTFGPPGPRGWQDEYCEWSVTRDSATNKITSVMFTCENPDYWFTLWQVDPNKVLEIYQQVISPAVQLSDLYLLDAKGQPAINPLTGSPAYNPLNKWNSGPLTTPGVSGGAMHLTSPPNTLGAEVYLAAAATLLRSVSSYGPQNMICCSKYGQPYRNSDPHIGFQANQLAKMGNTISLADPVGLYIQEPAWGVYTTPDGTPAQNFWTVMRGNAPSQILHAVFAVPANLGYTVSDIKINGQPIQWAGQIVQTFQMQLSAASFPGTSLPQQQVQDCQKNSPQPTPQVLALIDNGLLNAYNALYTIDGAVTNSPVLPAPIVQQGQTVHLALQCSDVAVDPTISFGDGITVTIKSKGEPQAVATATRQLGSLATRTFQLTITVAADAATGLRSLSVTNPGQTAVTAAPALLNVVPAGWKCGA
ncbi:MAG TPA: hypothetical protein VHU83_14440 [Bryobacteraceae bacterium]|jgi:hypothetical protein|nr:hypothetical protein [Bryobacteraceae bacterium]